MATGRFNDIVLGTNLSGVNNGDGSITISATGGGAPTGAAGGDLTGTYPNPTLAAAGGGAAGPVGDTTHTPVVTVDAKGRVTALTSAVIAPTGGTPSGSAGGDLTGTYPNPTLAAAGGGAVGPVGSSTVAPIITVDAKGRVTALSSATITPAAGSGGALTLIANSTLGVATATIDFTSIPSTYQHLYLILLGRGDTAATGVNVFARINNDSGANYDFQRVRGVASAASADQLLADTNGLLVGVVPGSTATADIASPIVITLPAYKDTTFQKAAVISASDKRSTSSADFQVHAIAVWWRSTAAITRITLRPSAGNFLTGTQASLYGMA